MSVRRWGSPSEDNTEKDDSEHDSECFSLEVKQLPDVEVCDANTGTTLAVSHRVTTSSSIVPESFSVNEQTMVRISKYKPITFDEAITCLYTVQCFFSLLCGRPVYVDWISLTHNETDIELERPRQSSWVSRRVRPPTVELLHPAYVLLPWSSISGCFETLWSNWIARMASVPSCI